MQQQNDAELYQCAHRARFVRNLGRTLIVVGQYWPTHLLGNPDVTIDKRRNGDSSRAALDRALGFYDQAGFFTKETAALFGVGAKRDAEKINALRESFLSGMNSMLNAGKEVPDSLREIVERVKEASQDAPLLFTDKNWWTNLLQQMRRHRPGIGELSVKLADWGKTWSKGLGSVEAAQRFYGELRMTAAQIGVETSSFDEKQWRQDRPDEGRQRV
jgi:hypothetical protein